MRKLILTPLAVAALAAGAIAAPAQAHQCADGAEPDGALTGVVHETVHGSGVLAPVPPADEAFGEAECVIHDNTGL